MSDNPQSQQHTDRTGPDDTLPSKQRVAGSSPAGPATSKALNPTQQAPDPLPDEGRGSDNSGTITGRLSLQVGRWPDRKRPLLSVYDSKTNCCHILAWFVNDRAAQMFLNAAKRGIVLDGQINQPGGAA